MVILRMGYAPINSRDGGSSEIIIESSVHSWPVIPKGVVLAN
jgi:hypothetical protein